MLNFPSSPAVNQVYSSGPSWMWDGVKWKAALPPASATVFTPVSGATVILENYLPAFINNASTLAVLTISLPPAMVNGLVEISFLKPVTLLTIRDAANVVVPTAPITAYGPGAGLMFRYVTRWEYWK